MQDAVVKAESMQRAGDMLNNLIEAGCVELEEDGSVTVKENQASQNIMGNRHDY